MVESIFKTVYGRVYESRRKLGIYIILLPMLMLVVYYTLIATERYASESRIVVKQGGELGQQLSSVSIPLLGISGGASKEDAMHLMEFIHSPDLMQRLGKEIEFEREFSLHGLDVFNHVMPWAKREDFLELYRRRIDLRYDNQRGVLVIRTHAKSAETALKLNQAILVEAEKFINELSHRIAREQLDFASSESALARQNLDKARELLLQFQNKSGLVDPAAELGITSQVIAGLEAQLAAKDVELRTLSTMMQENAPQVTTLRQLIASLRSQIEVERQKLASSQGGAMNRKAANYMDFKSMVDFQADIYRVSLIAMEKLRIDAARKVKSLAVISSPQLPDKPDYPQRTYLLAVWLLGLCVLYGFVRLSIEIIEDHRD